MTLWCILYFLNCSSRGILFRNLCQSSRSKKRMHCYKFGHGLCNSVQSPFTENTMLSVRVKLFKLFNFMEKTQQTGLSILSF